MILTEPRCSECGAAWNSGLMKFDCDCHFLWQESVKECPECLSKYRGSYCKRCDEDQRHFRERAFDDLKISIDEL